MSAELEDQDLETQDLPDSKSKDGEGEGEGGITPPPKKENDELRAALAELTTNVTKLSAPKKEEPRQKTQEELNKEWAVFNPEAVDEKFFHKLFRIPADASPEEVAEIKKTFGMLQNGLMKQAITGAKNYIEQLYGEKFAKVDQLEEWRNQASAKELRNDFNTEFPALADKKYDKVLKVVATELADRDFKDHNEYFKALAEGAAEYIKGIDASFDLGAKTTKTPGTSPKLPRTRVGGSGGTAGGAQTQPSGESNAIDELE